MRLLITLGFPPWRGGMQRYLYERCLLTPHQIAVAAPGRGHGEAWDRGQPFPIWRWRGGPTAAPGWRRLQQTAGAFAALRALRRRLPLTALELGQALPFGLVGLWARAHLGLPYVVWAFGDEFIKPACHPVARPILAAVLKRATAVYTVSHYTARLVRPWVTAVENVHVLHPWPALFFCPGSRESARERLGIPPDMTLLLGVGRLEPRKGIDRVIRALPLLRRAIPNLHYAVVGEGAAREQWARLAHALGVAESVTWCGEVEDDTLREWYRAADLFVLTPTPGPGEVEGFGLVFVEAAACGLPAVAGVNGGTPEAVRHGETGLLVFDDSPQALAEAVAALLRAPERRATMGRAAVEFARDLRARARAFPFPTAEKEGRPKP